MDYIYQKLNSLKNLFFGGSSEDIPQEISSNPPSLNELELIEAVLEDLSDSNDIQNELIVNENHHLSNLIYWITEDPENIILTEETKRKLRVLLEKGLRPIQNEIIKRVREGHYQTGIISCATGVGKSFCIFALIQHFKNDYLQGDTNRSIVIFTERKNILLDFFFKPVYENGKIKDWEIDEQKHELLRRSGLLDLNQFQMINLITNKNPNWTDEINQDTGKTKLIIINRTFLTKNQKYQEILYLYSPVLVLHDECHSSANISSETFLKYAKSEWETRLLGFSATPIRIGEGKNENTINKVREIYGSGDKINIYLSYNILSAVKDKICVPLKFVWYRGQKTNKGNKGRMALPKKLEVINIMRILEKNIGQMPFQKVLAWCSNINNAKAFKKLFQEILEENPEEYPLLMEFGVYTDHSNTSKNGYDEFCRRENKAILFCVGMHREGSDIKNLDTCIFLDKVKKRSHHVFLQCIGRVSRTSPNKEFGLVIDGFYEKEDEEESKTFIRKMVRYYLILENENVEEITAQAKIQMFDHILNNLYLNTELEQIEFNYQEGENPMTVRCHDMNWMDFSTHFEGLLGNILQQELHLDEMTLIKHNFKLIKDYLGINVFTPEISKTILSVPYSYLEGIDLPIETFEKWFKLVEEKMNWFDVLEIDTSSYFSLEDFTKNVNQLNLSTPNNFILNSIEKKFIPVDYNEYMNKLKITTERLFNLCRLEEQNGSGLVM